MVTRTYDAPVLTVAAAAELAGMHPQTLRQYDRLGLVVPHRTAGRGRRYTLRDVAALREVQRLSTEGVNLEGIGRILELQRENAALMAALEGLRAVNDPGSRVFAASTTGDVEAVPRGRRARFRPTASDSSGPADASRSSGAGALVLWRGGR